MKISNISLINRISNFKTIKQNKAQKQNYEQKTFIHPTASQYLAFCGG